jgi:glycerol-3-phosphate dehydrogenase
MQSMGEDLKDDGGKGHMEYKDQLHQDARHSFSMLSTILKDGGGHAALKDRYGEPERGE